MIQEDIGKSIIEAMKSKDSVRLEVLRAIKTAFTNELVTLKRTPSDKLNDDEALVVINRLAKQRKDSIEQYENGNRADLAKIEESELKILKEYLPEMMPEDELQKIAENKKKELEINDKSKSGILIGSLMKDLKGKADGSDVKRIVDSLFN